MLSNLVSRDLLGPSHVLLRMTSAYCLLHWISIVHVADSSPFRWVKNWSSACLPLVLCRCQQVRHYSGQLGILSFLECQQLGRGKLMDFNKYIFIMVQCSNTAQNYLRPKSTGTLYWFYYWFQGIQISPLRLSGRDWRPDQSHWGHCPGYARGLLWTWYLDFSSIFNNQPWTIPMWIYVNWDARTHT